MLIAVAISAILIPFVLLVIFRWPARYAMIISACLVAIGALAVWGISPNLLGASVVQGVHRALSIIWILLGAMTLMYTLKNAGAMDRIRQGFYHLSPDMRVQTVLVGFVFTALIEGVSGFGAPATIIAPLLLVLGFRPIAAAALALVGDAVPVSFGAVGTPVMVGLSNLPGAGAELYSSVGRTITYIDLVAAIIMPVAMVILLVYGLSDRPKKYHSVKEILPWTLMIGTFYGLMAIVAVTVFGVEFTSIISGLATLLFGAITIKKGWLIPKKVWRDILPKEARLSRVVSHMPLLVAWSPYILIVVLLLLTRTLPGVKDFLHSYGDISLSAIWGYPAITSSWHILYSPGTILLLTALVSALLHKLSPWPFLRGGFDAVKTAGGASLTLIFTLIMVQIFSNSGIDATQSLSMPAYIGDFMARNLGHTWELLAPTLGMLGAFIVGSSTVSTLTMSPIQYNIALDAGLIPNLVLAQQIVGANAGNIIAVHNVVAATAVVGLAHREGHVMRKVIGCVAVYLVCISLGSFVLYRMLSL